MKIQLYIKSIGFVGLCNLLFLWSNPASAYNGIILHMDGTGFYISARCYTAGGEDSVGPWRTNMAVGATHTCASPAEYVKIKRKTIWFQDRGSAWRAHGGMSCERGKHLCVEVKGSSIGNAYYKSRCKEHCI